MSPMRGDVKKILLPPLREETDVVVACIQPDLSSGEVVGRRVLRTRPSSLRFELDGFMTPWSFDAFGSGIRKQRCWLWWANHGPI